MVRREFEPHCEERFLDLALDGALVVQEQIFCELLGDRGAALHDAASAGVRHQCARGTGKVDAEVLVETSVFGREHGLDQMIGKLIERDGVVVLDAARADLVSVAIEEGHRQFGFFQPVIVRRFAECRDRQREHHDQADSAEGRPFRHDFIEAAPPAGDVEAIHEGRETLIGLAQAGGAAEDAEIDPCVQPEQEPLDVGLPVLGKQIAQSCVARKFNAGGLPARGILADRPTQGHAAIPSAGTR